jgi:hypothetical protein
VRESEKFSTKNVRFSDWKSSQQECEVVKKCERETEKFSTRM